MRSLEAFKMDLSQLDAELVAAVAAKEGLVDERYSLLSAALTTVNAKLGQVCAAFHDFIFDASHSTQWLLV